MLCIMDCAQCTEVLGEEIVTQSGFNKGIPEENRS